MLSNDKCILVYGFTKDELEVLKNIANLKLIVVDPEMGAMQVKDIISGLKIETYNKNIARDKVVLFNNCESSQLTNIIKCIKKDIGNVLLAVTTPVNLKWTFEYLLDHLIEERNWIESTQEGR